MLAMNLLMRLANNQVLRFVDNLANENMIIMRHDTVIPCDSVGRNPPSLWKTWNKVPAATTTCWWHRLYCSCYADADASIAGAKEAVYWKQSAFQHCKRCPSQEINTYHMYISILYGAKRADCHPKLKVIHSPQTTSNIQPINAFQPKIPQVKFLPPIANPIGTQPVFSTKTVAQVLVPSSREWQWCSVIGKAWRVTLANSDIWDLPPTQQQWQTKVTKNVSLQQMFISLIISLIILWYVYTSWHTAMHRTCCTKVESGKRWLLLGGG